MDDSVLAHLHTTMDCLERTRRLYGDGRHLRVRWESDGRYLYAHGGKGTGRTQAIVEHVRMALNPHTGKTGLDVRGLDRLPDTVTAHHRLAAVQALDNLHTATHALAAAWAEHQVLEPLLHTSNTTGRVLSLVASRSRKEDTFHLGLGQATLTARHTERSDRKTLVEAVRRAMAVPTQQDGDTTPLVLAGSQRHANVAGHPQAWAALVPVVCADQQAGVWALEQRIGLDDAPWNDTLVANTIRQSWGKLCQRIAAMSNEPLWSSKRLVWRNGEVWVSDSLQSTPQEEHHEAAPGQADGWAQCQAGIDALACAEDFLHTLVREAPVVAGGPHAPAPMIHLAHRTGGNGCDFPTLHALGGVHRNVDDCAALAGVPHGATTWMALAPNTNAPCAVFQTDTKAHAAFVADRLRGIGAVDLYKLVATPTS